MAGMLMETVVVAFVFGGIIGAITALHLASTHKRVPARVDTKRNHRTPH